MPTHVCSQPHRSHITQATMRSWVKALRLLLNLHSSAKMMLMWVLKNTHICFVLNKFLVKGRVFLIIFLQGLLLFADVDGKQFPVTRSPEGNNFQVSWTSKTLVKSGRGYKVRWVLCYNYGNFLSVLTVKIYSETDFLMKRVTPTWEKQSEVHRIQMQLKSCFKLNFNIQ